MSLLRPVSNTTQSRTKRFSNVFRKTEKLLSAKVSTSPLSSSHTSFCPSSTFISHSSFMRHSSFPSGMTRVRACSFCFHRQTSTHVMRWYTNSSAPFLMPFSLSFSRSKDGKRNDQSRAVFSSTSPTSLPEYVIERSFDEPTLRFLLEGNLIDVKQEIREALIGVLPPPPRHFSSRKGREQEIHFYHGGDESGSGGGAATQPISHSTNSTDQKNSRKRAFNSSNTAFRVVDPISPVATKLLLRAFLQRHLGVSYAMYRSSMDRLLALYETVAMAHPVLASVLAQHFTAAGLLASHGSPSLLQRYSHWLDGADSGHILGTVATHELIAEEGPPVNTEAVYDYHEKCFVLRGTGKFAVVGAMMADYVIISAVLTTKKNEHNGVHLFVVPLREEKGEKKKGEESLNEDKKKKGSDTNKVNGSSEESASQAPPRFSSLGSRRSDIKLQPIEGEGDVFTASGTGVIYFDHTRIPADHLLGPFRMDEAAGSVCLPNHFSGKSDATNEKKMKNSSQEKEGTAVDGEKKMKCSASFRSSCYSLLSSMVATMKPFSAMFSSLVRLKPFRALGTFTNTSGGVKDGNMHTSLESSSSFPLHWWFSSAMRMGGRRTRREDEMETAGEVLRFRFRLASAAITLGILKKQVRDAVQYTTQQHIIGPSGFRDYPYFGLQEVQTPLVTMIVKASVLTFAWNQYLQQWLSLSATSKEQGGTSTSPSSSLTWRDRQKRLMQLTGLLSMLDSVVLFELEDFRRRFTHVHAFFSSTGAESWSNATIQLRQEYRNQHERLREVARSSVVFNIGNTHWGWRVSSIARRFPSLQRFFQNPLYSPRIADLGRHYLFFAHQHYGLKKRLQRALQLETRRGGTLHAWHDWRTFRHGDVLRCGEAYMEVYLMNGMMEVVQQCSSDLRGRKLLRDMAWIFALSRQKDLLGYYVTTGLLSRQKGLILTPHLENLCTVFAPQARHVAEALCGRWYDGDGSKSPPNMRERCTEDWGSGASQAPPTTSGMQHSRRMAEAAAALCDAPCASEAYWTIIGASTRPERGESLTTTASPGRGSGRRGNGGEEEWEEGTKEAEDRVQEDLSEWDMLHGLENLSKRERKEMQEREEKNFFERSRKERKQKRVMGSTA